MGVSYREYLKYGDKGPGNRSSAHRSEGVGSSLRKGYFKHHWSYYKAKAVSRRNAAQKVQT